MSLIYYTFKTDETIIIWSLGEFTYTFPLFGCGNLIREMLFLSGVMELANSPNELAKKERINLIGKTCY